MSELERQTANRLLAKAIAYQNCGKQKQGDEYARALVVHLQQCGFDLSASRSISLVEQMRDGL